MGEAYIVYHGARTAPDELEHDASVEWRQADELFAGDVSGEQPALLIADETMVEQLARHPAIPAHAVVIATDAASAGALGDRTDVRMLGALDPAARSCILDVARRLASSRIELARLQGTVERTAEEFHELSRIGMALMNERDRAVLIELILTQGKELTGSDGGGLLLRKEDEDGVARLHPEAYRFDSLPHLGLPDMTFAIDDTSVVGHAAVTKQPIAVADARTLPSGASFVASEEFQRRYQYRARSMLAVPMLTQLNEVLGVLFFINRKSEPRTAIRSEDDADRYVVPYTDREVRLVHSLASQAAVSIENSWLYAQIEHMLESLVTAAVSAIDARDPTTAGHSARVAVLATALAEAVDRTNRGAYRELHFTRAQMRELRFAALLHDLGKVTVREDVLVKAKKLPPILWERVAARFDLIRQSLRLEHCGRSNPLDEQLADRLRELDGMFAIVRAANEPTVEDRGPDRALEKIAERTFEGPDGNRSPYLSPDELHYLRLARGTLDERERAEIQAHVEHTRRFLSQIPWTDDLKGLVDYAYGHHERLNGTGYPLRLRGEDIPVPTRIISIADIFDALTEADRPYKPAVSSGRAIEILHDEARAGCIDGELVDILTQSEVYRTVLGEQGV